MFVVPCWNAGPHLEVLLRSLLAQSRPADRILVVDDASTDGSADVARRVGGERVEVAVNRTRLGIGGNWNRALELVDTDYVCLAHMDDVYDPHFLAHTLPVLAADARVGAVHTGAFAVDEAGERFAAAEETYKTGMWAGLDHADRAAVYRRLYRGNFVNCPSVVLRTAAHRAAGPFDTTLRFALDWKAHFELLLAGYRIHGVPRPLVGYRRHAGSQSARLKGGVERHREEVAVAAFARDAGIRAGLLPAATGPSRAPRNNLLLEAFQALCAGDRDGVRARLAFARQELPGGARDPLVRAFAAAVAAGPPGRVALRAGLAALLFAARLRRPRRHSM